MSATLGEGSDLERLTGVRNIYRLGAPEDLDAQGVGRRFFVFPGRSLSLALTEIALTGSINGARKVVNAFDQNGRPRWLADVLTERPNWV
jgi:hypothetical protein